MFSNAPKLLLCLLLIPHAAAPPAAAQDTVTGAFQGTVTSSDTGEPVAGAAVEIVHRETGQTYAKTSDALGRWYQGLLHPGLYTIRVSARGFRPQEKQQRIFITVSNEAIPIPFALEAEDQTPAARPTPASPQPTAPTPRPVTAPAGDEGAGRDAVAEINRTDARRSGSFTEEEVSTLPLGASTFTRTFDELALLLPGVAPPPQTLGSVAGPGVGAGVGSAGQFSVNGLRSRGNNFTVDGSDNNDEDIGVRRQGFVALNSQPIESVREYQAITLLAPAQFGRNIGAQVNAVSKSGGAGTHGAIYGFFNSSRLNARNPLDTADGNATAQLRAGGRNVLRNGRPLTVTNQSGGEDSFTLAQFGLAFGGPLVPGKAAGTGPSLYYFFSAEGQLFNATREASFAVPTVEQRGLFGTGATGLARDPFTGRVLDCTPELCEIGFPTTVGGDAVFSLFPFPNNSRGIYGANTLTQVLPAGGQGRILSGKLDGNFRVGGRQQSVTSRYNFTDDYRDVAVTGGALFSSLRPRVRTQNLSNFLNSELSAPGGTAPVFNQVRASYGRTRLVFDELRDTEFLVPSRLGERLTGEARKFLLNAPLVANNTLPVFPNVVYGNFGRLTVEDALGPVGQINIAGFSPVGVDVFNFPQRRVNNTYQLADLLTARLSRHGLALGADSRRTELNSELPRNSRPLITFNGSPRIATDAQGRSELRGFFDPVDLAAAGAPSGVFQTLNASGGDAISLRYYQHNFFAHDDWRVRPDLSLSLGLRYEYNTPPRELSRRIERTFDDPALSLVPGLREFVAGRAAIFDPDRDNFAPRLGLAYSANPLGPARATVLRAGYGIFYDQIIGAVVSQSRNVYPTFLTLNFAGGRSDSPAPGATGLEFNLFNPDTSFFPCGGNTVPVRQPGTLNALNPAAPLGCLVGINNSFPGGFGITLPARRLRTPAAQHYNVTVEQQLAATLVASAAYVGTRGRRLLRLTTPNLGPNAFLVPTAATILFNNPRVSGTALGPGQRVAANGAVTGGRPVPTAGAVNIYESNASSRYDSLQLQLRGSWPRRAQYQISYTLSEARDDVSDVFDLAGAPALPQNSLTFEGERGPANFDVRHRVSYNFIYDLPRAPGFAGALFGGWQIAGLGKFHTGQPFTVNSIFDVNLDGNLTDRLDTTDGLVETGDRRRPLLLTAADHTSLLAPVGRDGRVPRNTFRAGSVLELDLSFVRRVTVARGHALLLRADLFNFINRANYGVPVRYLGAPGFGQAVNTVTPGRRIQFALKYSF